MTAKNIDIIAGRLGAKVIARLPEVGGGAFGAARLARIVEQLRPGWFPDEVGGPDGQLSRNGCGTPRCR